MKSWRYKKDREPKIFEGEALIEAEKDGWVDCPTKVDVKKTTRRKRAVKDVNNKNS